MILWIFISIFIILSALLFMMDDVQTNGEERIIYDNNIPKDIKVILILGAGVKESGLPSDILVDRLETAIKVSENINDVKILLSGDHKNCSYNEVGAMKKYIMKYNKEICEKNIFLDHSGFSTYESIYRAKNIFQIDKMIVISNEYHLPRALYLAKKFGINAYGVKSDIRYYEDLEIYKERELLAQVKDFIYVNILRVKPRFTDEKISIDKSDGRNTDL